jgi:hypothetical protein
MYEALLIATAVLCLAGILTGAWYYRDSFHPLVYLGALLGTLYVGYPVRLLAEGDLWLFLSENSLIEIQSIYLAGVTAMLLGIWKGAGSRVNLKGGSLVWAEIGARRARMAAIVLGLVGVVGFFYCVLNVGGIEAAFGQSYGAGWSDNGYVRELFLFTLPALLWLMIAYPSGRQPTWPAWGLILLIASPLLMQGFLGARRGPMFMAVSGLGLGWYLRRRKRPHILIVLVGGVLVGAALLFLVTNRDEIYLGSTLHLEMRPLDYVKAGEGNEYLYGGALILHAKDQGQTFWGRRYLQLFLVRPIPRSWWPSKYDDASQFLGVPSVDGGNQGLATTDLRDTVGWAGSMGATPGIVADLWVEFGWLGLAGLFGLGWIYGHFWRMGMTHGRAWVPRFGIITALSIYLVMQSLEAMGFRALLMLAASAAIQKYGDGDHTVISSPASVRS